MSELDDITGAIVDSAVKIHKELGPGLLESVYEAVLARALERRNFQVVRQKSIRFEYDGMVDEPLRRAAHQFRWCHPQGRPRTDRQPPPALRLSAPPREPTQPRP